ncbi:MAG: phage holin family protein [Deltaproteobacteria bacterium]|jgi:uncharacterized membrane protein YqjE|nr:phage holin family protein [Deltaproteobacteria bacterium]
MADDPAVQGKNHGLLATASRLLATLVSAAETRVGILATELQEEGVRLGRLLLIGVATLFCLGLGIVLLAVFVVVLYWDSNRLAVLGLLSGLFLGVGLVCAVVLSIVGRRHKMPLAETADVLSRDRQSLERDR